MVIGLYQRPCDAYRAALSRAALYPIDTSNNAVVNTAYKCNTFRIQ